MAVSQEPSWRRMLEGALGIPATEGNEVEVLRDGAEIFPAMLAEIEAAERTIDLLTFVYWRGAIARRFASRLSERARAGVRCRIVLDAIGARHVEHDLLEEMSDAGVLVHWFRPLLRTDDLTEPGYRTHRKVLVCDERVGFAGGIGIAEEWDGSSDDATGWRETQVRVRGPAVDGLRAAFLDDWLDSPHPLLDERDRFPEQPQDGTTTVMVVRGESEQGRSDIAMLRQLLFTRARRRIRISAPYLAPDDATLEALCSAARRGVEVQLLVPGDNNDKLIAQLASDRLYPHLLEAGVEVHHYRPTMLHAKVVTVDGEVAITGSANLNHRSLQLDEEVDLVLLDAEVTAQLDAHTEHDLTRCTRLREEDLRAPTRVAAAPLRLLTGLVERLT